MQSRILMHFSLFLCVALLLLSLLIRLFIWSGRYLRYGSLSLHLTHSINFSLPPFRLIDYSISFGPFRFYYLHSVYIALHSERVFLISFVEACCCCCCWCFIFCFVVVRSWRRLLCVCVLVHINKKTLNNVQHPKQINQTENDAQWWRARWRKKLNETNTKRY